MYISNLVSPVSSIEPALDSVMSSSIALRSRSLRHAFRTACIASAVCACFGIHTYAAEQYFAGDGSALSASKYTATTGSPSPITGPFGSAFVSGNIIGFDVANGTGTGGSVTVGGFDALENFTLTSNSGTISNASNGVVGITVAAGKVLDFNAQSFTTSGTAGYTFNGNSTGVLALAGGTFAGGFTLSSGTVIARGTNALGNGALTINGGTISGSASRNFATKLTSITVGGDFQLGALVANSALSTDTASLTFGSPISLGTATTRTITLGNLGTQTLSGVISGSSGLTFAAVSGAGSTVASNGTIAITNTGNNFIGAININGPEVTFAGDGSLGNTANTINIDGGRFTVTASSSITAGRGIQVGSTAGTSISTSGSSPVVTYNGVVADKSSGGILVKQGSGTLALGGVSTYTGDTSINNGTLQLTISSDRLPTGTTVNLGQAASANVGTFDLNARSQQIAGLNSTAGTNASTTAKNTVTSAATATLTLGGSGNYVYGAGTAANSGVITGAVAVNKTGGGTQTFGDANAYTGGTTVSGGTLSTGNASGTFGSGGVTVAGATLTLGNAASIANTATLTFVGASSRINMNAVSGTTETLAEIDGNGFVLDTAGVYSADQLNDYFTDGSFVGDNTLSVFASSGTETFTISPAPEPVSAALFVLSGGVLLGRRGLRRIKIDVIDR